MSLEQMPLLSCQFLKGYREQRLAHLVLSSITMGYVWQEGEAQPKEVRGREMPVLSSACSSAPGISSLLGTILFKVYFLIYFVGYPLKDRKRDNLNKELLFFLVGS